MTEPKFPGSSGLTINKDYTVWSFDFLLSTSFSISTKSVIDILPEGLYPVEVGPEDSLFNITVVRFVEGESLLMKSFSEVILGVQVKPINFHEEKNSPQVSLFLLKLGADSSEFLSNFDTNERMLFEDDPLKIEIDFESLSAECASQEDLKIFSLKGGNREADYFKDMFHVRMYSESEKKLFYSDLFLNINRFQLLGKSSNLGSLYDNRFFHPLKYDAFTNSSYCYSQIWLDPGTLGKEYCLPFKPLM